MGIVVDLDEKDRLEWEAEQANYRLARSKSSVKKDMYEITDFGKDLMELNDNQLKKIPLDETLLINIKDARDMQKIALKRQTQFIGKLLRKANNLDEIKEAYDAIVSKNKEANLLFNRLENVRDNLLDAEKSAEALAKVIETYPTVDVQKLRQLIRNHHKEVEKNKPKKSYKEIFQVLKQLAV